MNIPVPKGRTRNHPRHHLISEPEFVLDASTFRVKNVDVKNKFENFPFKNFPPAINPVNQTTVSRSEPKSRNVGSICIPTGKESRKCRTQLHFGSCAVAREYENPF
jgi:hypothetical protein